MAWSGADVPAAAQAWARAVARARPIAASAVSASAASTLIRRETVGSEATAPKISGWARSCAMSARQSPPIANAVARSSTILSGSCRASGFRYGASSVVNAVVRPVFSAVRSSRAAPAWDTTPVPVADADTRG